MTRKLRTLRGRDSSSALLPEALIDELLRPLEAVLFGSVGGDGNSNSVVLSPMSTPTGVGAATASPAVRSPLSSYAFCASSSSLPLPPSERSSLFLQLYGFVLEQLSLRHPPAQFLGFVPQVGSANFFLPRVKDNWRKHNERQRKSGNGNGNGAGSAAAAVARTPSQSLLLATA